MASEEVLTLRPSPRKMILVLAGVSGLGFGMVVFDPQGLGKETLQAINRDLTGARAELPDTYGMKPQHLADLMNAWRSRNLFPIRQ